VPSYDHPRPALTADVVAVSGVGAGRQLLLVRRGGGPFVGRWALPGGFVEEWEPPVSAAARELGEETGVHADPGELSLAGVYGEEGRDPRGWTVSCAYLARLDRAAEATAGDDAGEVRWWPLDGLPELAFDHARIVAEVTARG